jgi:16S rRNA (guanine1207-N2)-methyltransferase
VETTDLRYVRRPNKCSSFDATVYFPDSHDPESLVAHRVSSYLEEGPVFLFGYDSDCFTGQKAKLGRVKGIRVLDVESTGLERYAWEQDVNGVRARFRTERGVFSPEAVDIGTEVLLQALPTVSAPFLDVACGYGAVSKYVALQHGVSGLAVDSDEQAVRLAKNNIEGLPVTVKQSYFFDGVDGSFDYVFSNPPTHTPRHEVRGFFEDGAKALSSQGSMYIVINRAVRYEDLWKESFVADEVGGSDQFTVLRLRHA